MTEYELAIRTANLLPDDPKIDPDSNECMLARQFLRANAIASVAGSVPEGWQLVPIEPTEKMLKASAGQYVNGRYGYDLAKYRAMLAAAPQPPEQKV